jgi:hypothetical protein
MSFDAPPAAGAPGPLLRKSKTKLDRVLLGPGILLAMTALAHNPLAVEVRRQSRASDHARGTTQLRLRATGDGWSLIDADGAMVFRGFGLGGRRECLEFARRHGVLAVFS